MHLLMRVHSGAADANALVSLVSSTSEKVLAQATSIKTATVQCDQHATMLEWMLVRACVWRCCALTVCARASCRNWKRRSPRRAHTIAQRYAAMHACALRV
jgi:hypothetical protein